jgi:hypothetical protein
MCIVDTKSARERYRRRIGKGQPLDRIGRGENASGPRRLVSGEKMFTRSTGRRIVVFMPSTFFRSRSIALTDVLTAGHRVTPPDLRAPPIDSAGRSPQASGHAQPVPLLHWTRLSGPHRCDGFGRNRLVENPSETEEFKRYHAVFGLQQLKNPHENHHAKTRLRAHSAPWRARL